MKKSLLLVSSLLMLLMLTLCACGGEKTVTITLPGEFFAMEGAVTQAELDATAEAEGYEALTLNDDGTVSAVFTKEQHEEIMAEMKAGIDEMVQDLLTSGDCPSFVAIEPNDNYSLFKITVTTPEIDPMEEFSASFGLGMGAAMYQIMNGTPDVELVIQYIDQNTGEIIKEVNSADE